MTAAPSARAVYRALQEVHHLAAQLGDDDQSTGKEGGCDAVKGTTRLTFSVRGESRGRGKKHGRGGPGGGK